MPNPTILWAQDRDIVYVTIQISGNQGTRYKIRK